jgi:hypothetical protein
MRFGKITVECDTFYLNRALKKCSNVKIEEYQTKLDIKHYDALISIYTSAEEPLTYCYRIIREIQKNKQSESFETLCKASERVFCRIRVNDGDYVNHPIRYLQNMGTAKFPGRIIPTIAEGGTLCIYGILEDERALDQCIAILGKKEGINVRADECDTWTADYTDTLNSVPTIFHALGIGPKRTNILLLALFGDKESIQYLKNDINLLETIFPTGKLEERELEKLLSSLDLKNLLKIYHQRK